MLLETWLAFVLASAIVVVIPGPNIVLTVTYGIRGGWRTGLGTVPGQAFGALLAMTASLAGAGAVLATSVMLFTLLKMAGALYLLWLAYQLWTAPLAEIMTDDTAPRRSTWALFRQSTLVSALNPKGPVFYVAFVPQFVDPTGPIFGQFAVLTATFVAVAFLNGVMWLAFAARMRGLLSGAFAVRLIQQIGAAFLGVAGLAALRLSRSTP